MRNLKTLCAVFLLSVCNVQAGSTSSGVIESIDLNKGVVQINSVRYQILEAKTSLTSGEHKLRLKSLKVGNNVDYVIENSLVTEIRLKTPRVFNY